MAKKSAVRVSMERKRQFVRDNWELAEKAYGNQQVRYKYGDKTAAQLLIEKLKVEMGYSPKTNWFDIRLWDAYRLEKKTG